MVGKPVIRGTRIPVERILEILSVELDVDAVLREYPALTRDDVQACLEYALDVVAEERVLQQRCGSIVDRFYGFARPVEVLLENPSETREVIETAMAEEITRETQMGALSASTQPSKPRSAE